MVRKLYFKIKGNQEDPDGNAVPYFRTTQGSQWKKGAKRYHAWKDFVRAQVIDVLAAMKSLDREQWSELIDFRGNKPIKATDKKVWMKIYIIWKNKTHADSDNVFKGIADALFMNDKYLVGEFDYEYGESGSVSVEITF